MNFVYTNIGAERLDKFLSKKFKYKYSRNQLQKLIEDNFVLVNNLPSKSRQILRVGDSIKIDLPKTKTFSKPKPANIDLDIIYEDDNLLVINKPSGMVVHPSTGNNEKTLVNALINYYPKIVSATHDNSELSMTRPGIVHRLDKDTSGLLVVAKNQKTLMFLSNQFKNREVVKKYWALCYGWPKNASGEVTNFLGRNPKNRLMISDIGTEKGRVAKTKYKLIKHFADKCGCKLSLIEFNILTGRTHQIRVLAKILKVPILGDQLYFSKESAVYSKKTIVSQQLLHAKDIYFRLNESRKVSHFEAPLPKIFEQTMNYCTKFDNRK